MPPLVDSSWLLAFVVKASAVIGVAAVADGMLRRRASAATRHWVWTLAVVMLVLPALSLTLPAWTVVVPYAPAGEATSVSSASAAIEAGLRPRDTEFQSDAEGLPLNDVGPAPGQAGLQPSEPGARSFFPSLATLALSLYILGLVVFGARLAVQQMAAHRLVRSARDVGDPAWTSPLADCATRLGVRRPVRLLRSHERSMPMAIGVRAGVIVIPSIADTWTMERRRAVLLHELAHVGRHDCLTQLLAQVACALYWPHPGVWWAARRLRVEREVACDDRVLRAGTEARDYAGHLLEIAYDLGSHHAPALAVSMARPGQLEGRMLAVLDAARNRATPGVRARLLGILAALAVLLPLAVIVTTAEPLTAAVDELSTTGAAAASPVVPASPPAHHPKHDEDEALAQAAQATGRSSQTGAWTLQPSENKPGMVYLEMRENRSSSGQSIPLSQLEGLTAAQVSGAGPVRFAVRRDAGTFNFDGTFRNGVGGGVYSFAASQTFPGELEKRGIARPTADQQYDMARHDVGLALVDELNRQGYPKPSVADLVRAGHHGVRLDYVKELDQLGYRVGTMDALVKLRDHGVTPGYIREMSALGLPRLSADELVRVRDHGVTPEYARELKELGYGSLSIDQLVNARDHGVSPEFVKELGALGYTTLSMEQVVNARDHGVSSSFAREMKELGYQATLADLVRARDHGVSADKIRRANEKAGTKLPLDKVRSMVDKGLR